MRKNLALAAVCLCACLSARADNFLVLPFYNVSGDVNLEWIGESLSETVREALASEGIIALSRDDRQEAFRRLSLRPNTQLTRASILRIGEFLDADQVIHGQFTFTPPAAGEAKTKDSNLRSGSEPQKSESRSGFQ
jgi:hypothetical protein